jgi:hypothetical protein
MMGDGTVEGRTNLVSNEGLDEVEPFINGGIG